MQKAPSDPRDFLSWFRRRTEAVWETVHEPNIKAVRQNNVGGSFWRRGTKWKPGLDNTQIADIEAQCKVRFPPEYWMFLLVLNTPNRGMMQFTYANLGSEISQDEDVRAFPDWVGHPDQVQEQFQRPLEGWYFDLEHEQGWYEFMGPKPKTLEEQKIYVRQQVDKSLRLIPVFGHRYLVAPQDAVSCWFSP